VEKAYARTRERNRVASVNLVPLRAQTEGTRGQSTTDQKATFGQRRGEESKRGKATRDLDLSANADGGMEMSWVPSSSSAGVRRSNEDAPDEWRRGSKTRKGTVTFGMGMERGGKVRYTEISENERKGRTQRRTGVRSGSRNALRRTPG
jgi:ribosome biogenesis protein ENP2